ncbi:hypothetical protein RFI_18915 [Reticulomyxa filosa]|uniref:Uncharacterized protein n=1 Tax=Reticulomyxa filosa TaxID=46433 RepID=X6MWK9_RETFI|nr:hypothetical protein RFI_18915 [Reticulomyxa filosa]|eukprot:ETO18363.1 hypothetical protein RFI_18915 [Reticulomyxa filosa]
MYLISIISTKRMLSLFFCLQFTFTKYFQKSTYNLELNNKICFVLRVMYVKWDGDYSKYRRQTMAMTQRRNEDNDSEEEEEESSEGSPQPIERMPIEDEKFAVRGKGIHDKSNNHDQRLQSTVIPINDKTILSAPMTATTTNQSNDFNNVNANANANNNVASISASSLKQLSPHEQKQVDIITFNDLKTLEATASNSPPCTPSENIQPQLQLQLSIESQEQHQQQQQEQEQEQKQEQKQEQQEEQKQDQELQSQVQLQQQQQQQQQQQVQVQLETAGVTNTTDNTVCADITAIVPQATGITTITADASTPTTPNTPTLKTDANVSLRVDVNVNSNVNTDNNVATISEEQKQEEEKQERELEEMNEIEMKSERLVFWHESQETMELAQCMNLSELLHLWTLHVNSVKEKLETIDTDKELWIDIIAKHEKDLSMFNEMILNNYDNRWEEMVDNCQRLQNDLQWYKNEQEHLLQQVRAKDEEVWRMREYITHELEPLLNAGGRAHSISSSTGEHVAPAATESNSFSIQNSEIQHLCQVLTQQLQDLKYDGYGDRHPALDTWDQLYAFTFSNRSSKRTTQPIALAALETESDPESQLEMDSDLETDTETKIEAGTYTPQIKITLAHSNADESSAEEQYTFPSPNKDSDGNIITTATTTTTTTTTISSSTNSNHTNIEHANAKNAEHTIEAGTKAQENSNTNGRVPTKIQTATLTPTPTQTQMSIKTPTKTKTPTSVQTKSKVKLISNMSKYMYESYAGVINECRQMKQCVIDSKQQVREMKTDWNRELKVLAEKFHKFEDKDQELRSDKMRFVMYKDKLLQSLSEWEKRISEESNRLEKIEYMLNNREQQIKERQTQIEKMEQQMQLKKEEMDKYMKALVNQSSQKNMEMMQYINTRQNQINTKELYLFEETEKLNDLKNNVISQQNILKKEREYWIAQKVHKDEFEKKLLLQQQQQLQTIGDAGKDQDIKLSDIKNLYEKQKSLLESKIESLELELIHFRLLSEKGEQSVQEKAKLIEELKAQLSKLNHDHLDLSGQYEILRNESYKMKHQLDSLTQELTNFQDVRNQLQSKEQLFQKEKLNLLESFHAEKNILLQHNMSLQKQINELTSNLESWKQVKQQGDKETGKEKLQLHSKLKKPDPKSDRLNSNRNVSTTARKSALVPQTSSNNVRKDAPRRSVVEQKKPPSEKKQVKWANDKTPTSK